MKRFNLSTAIILAFAAATLSALPPKANALIWPLVQEATDPVYLDGDPDHPQGTISSGGLGGSDIESRTPMPDCRESSAALTIARIIRFFLRSPVWIVR